MEKTKELLNEVLVKVFNQIMFSEEQNLSKLIGKEITVRDVHVIEAIDVCNANGTPYANVVAKYLNITAGTLTTAIKRLEHKGYVVRSTGLEDKRQVMLSLTSKGQKINSIHHDFHVKMVNEITKGLNLEEEKLMVELLNKVIEFFK